MDTKSAPAVAGARLRRIAAETATPPGLTPARLRSMMRPYDGPRDLPAQLALADTLAGASLALPEQFRGRPRDLVALMYHAIDLDIGLSVAWSNLVFGDGDGAVGVRARLIAALTIRAGHRIIPLHDDDTMARMLLLRGDGGVSGIAQWTRLEAASAGLLSADDPESVWSRYVADSLWARCVSRVVRRFAPDVLAGGYIAAEELSRPPGDADRVDVSRLTLDADGNPVPVPAVAALVDGLDGAPPVADLADRWRRAYDAGLLSEYAGTVDGVTMSVRDLLFHLGNEIGRRRRRSRRATPPPAAVATTTAAAPAADVLDRPAGTGDRLPCGCVPAAVVAAGEHQPGCTRGTGPARAGRSVEPAAGQIWRSRSRRETDRRVRVVDVDNAYVYTAPATPPLAPHQQPGKRRRAPRRASQVRVDRWNRMFEPVGSPT